MSDLPSAKMLRAYINAPSPQNWLEAELKKSLGEGLPDEESVELVKKVREEARLEADQFLETEVDPQEIIAVVLAFAKPGEDATGATGGIFKKAPTPVALLELAANECDILDEVVVSHRYASGEEVILSKTWPFALSGAVDLLTPGAAPLVQE